MSKITAQLDAEIAEALARKKRGSLKFYVFRRGDVVMSRDRYSATAKPGVTPESTHDNYDTAYEAAFDAGGDRWVISSVGSSEYVESEK